MNRAAKTPVRLGSAVTTLARRGCAVMAALGCAAAASPSEASTLRIVSGETVVFDWKTQRCEDNDIPDTPLRAFRDADGRIVAFASHYDVRRFVGPSLRSLVRECAVVRRSRRDPDPKAFDGLTWVIATWSSDGRSVYALGHNEFQAHKHAGRCGFPDYRSCWYNTVVELRSADGGATFVKDEARDPVASINQRSEDGQGKPRGFFAPTNLIERDGFLYTFMLTTGASDQPGGYCIFRTSIEAVGGTWEFLSETGWVSSRHNPYTQPPGALCRVIRNLYDVGSVTLHRPSGRYLAVGTIPGGPSKGSFTVSTSVDLTSWTTPEPFLAPEKPSGDTGCPRFEYGYPALLDETSRSRNFDEVGDRPLLFLTKQWKKGCDGTLDRDLVVFEVQVGN